METTIIGKKKVPNIKMIIYWPNDNHTSYKCYILFHGWDDFNDHFHCAFKGDDIAIEFVERFLDSLGEFNHVEYLDENIQNGGKVI